jgi:hypothetical protein
MLPIDVFTDLKKGNILNNGLNLTRLMKEVQSRTTQTMADNGFAVIYSASKGQLASDGPEGGNSPFTAAFLQTLSKPDDELSDTYRNIRIQMETSQQNDPFVHKQTPYFENALRVKFYLSRPEWDTRVGVSKILIFDSCRDNPFNLNVVAN